jgi:hypothetical protein
MGNDSTTTGIDLQSLVITIKALLNGCTNSAEAFEIIRL